MYEKSQAINTLIRSSQIRLIDLLINNNSNNNNSNSRTSLNGASQVSYVMGLCQFGVRNKRRAGVGLVTRALK